MTESTTTETTTSKWTVQIRHEGEWIDWMTRLNASGAVDVRDALIKAGNQARAITTTTTVVVTTVVV